MKSIAIDTSDKTASVAVFNDDRLISEFFLHTGFTHSQTLLPMIDSCLSISETNISEIEQFVVAVGPGSFTGLRIGISTIKGFAMAKQNHDNDLDVVKNCKAVSTLEAMAYNLIDMDGIIVPTIDARCNQVYVSLFEAKNRQINRITDDVSVSLEKLRDHLEFCSKEISGKKIFLLGNGADLCYNYLNDNLDGKTFGGEISLVSENLRYQKASGLFQASKNKPLISHFDLIPRYLKLCQAQRNLVKKHDYRFDGKHL